MSPRFPHIASSTSHSIEAPRLVHRSASASNETEASIVESPAQVAQSTDAESANGTEQATPETVAAEQENRPSSLSTNGTSTTENVQEFVAEVAREVSAVEIPDANTENNLEISLAEEEVPNEKPRRGRPPRDVSTQTTEQADAPNPEDDSLDTEDSVDAEDSITDELESDDETFAPDPVSRRTQREQSSAREFDLLFAEWKNTGDPRIRERLILMNRNLVSYIARRFMDRGEMSEDIIQQGLIGLINALDHFDPSRGVRFATFATPTIMGEIRRYFRDKSWGIRVPRRLQELNQVINSRIDELTQTLDRSPTYVEIARSLNLQLEEVVEALEMASVLDPMSIDEEVSFGNNDSPTTVGDQIGAPDPQLEGWGEYAALQAALEKLPEKERRVLEMVYFNDHSQVEVARQMNVSQMFVSRLQRRALAHLRELMNGHDI